MCAAAARLFPRAAARSPKAALEARRASGAGITHGVLRKVAHFLEFAVLGILLTGTFHGARNFTLAKPMLFAVLTAMTDETIQSFTPGRNCALSDVWLDAAGALTGAVLLWLIFKLRKK